MSCQNRKWSLNGKKYFLFYFVCHKFAYLSYRNLSGINCENLLVKKSVYYIIRRKPNPTRLIQIYSPGEVERIPNWLQAYSHSFTKVKSSQTYTELFNGSWKRWRQLIELNRHELWRQQLPMVNPFMIMLLRVKTYA